MDSITHVFLGAAIGQAVVGKKNNHKAALLGALASTAPDFDVFIRSSHNSLLGLEMHRSFTHSLLFIPFGALITLGLVLLFCKSMRQDWKFFLWVCLLAYGSHSLLDSCTSYGTQLFWPFSHERVSWDIISIIDPVFTILLILGFSFSWRKKDSKPAIIGLICALIYLGFCAIQHERALSVEEQLIQTRQQSATQVRVMPALANIYSWNGLYVTNGRIYSDVIKTPLLSSSYSIAGFSTPQFTIDQLPTNLQKPELIDGAEVFTWFSQDYTSVAQVTPFVLVDMRYLEKGQEIVSLWGIALLEPAQKDEIVRLARVLLDPHKIKWSS